MGVPLTIPLRPRLHRTHLKCSVMQVSINRHFIFSQCKTFESMLAQHSQTDDYTHTPSKHTYRKQNEEKSHQTPVLSKVLQQWWIQRYTYRCALGQWISRAWIAATELLCNVSISSSGYSNKDTFLGVMGGLHSAFTHKHVCFPLSCTVLMKPLSGAKAHMKDCLISRLHIHKCVKDKNNNKKIRKSVLFNVA